MTGKKLGVGVIGCGFGSEAHVPGFNSLPNVQVLAVCDIQKELAEKIALKYNVDHVFTDHREMLKLQGIDIVSVASPVFLHHSMAIDVINAGKHILCEKPLGLNNQEGEDLLARAEAAGVVHGVDHEFRFMPPHAKLKQLAEENYFGAINSVNITIAIGAALKGHEIWGWQSQREKGGGMLNSSGYHYVDLTRYCFGDVVEVCAQLETIVKEKKVPDTGEMRKVTSEDAFAILLRLAKGGLVSINENAVALHGAGTRIEVYGSNATAVIESRRNVTADGGVIETSRKLFGGMKGDKGLEEIPLPEGQAAPGVSRAPQNVAFTKIAGRLVEAINRGTGTNPDFKEGLKTLRVMTAVRQSAAEHKWVAVA